MKESIIPQDVYRIPVFVSGVFLKANTLLTVADNTDYSDIPGIWLDKDESPDEAIVRCFNELGVKAEPEVVLDIGLYSLSEDEQFMNIVFGCANEENMEDFMVGVKSQSGWSPLSFLDVDDIPTSNLPDITKELLSGCIDITSFTKQ